MTTEKATPATGSVALAWTGWILTALLLVYAALLHKGIGPIPGNLESNWYNPNKFLLDGLMARGAGDAMESVGSALALLALPALATAVAVFFTTRSAILTNDRRTASSSGSTPWRGTMTRSNPFTVSVLVCVPTKIG